MKITGSCHCQKVRFELETLHPVPYQRCYCMICRKTGGGGGYMINLSGDAASLSVEGEESVRIYRAILERDGERVQSAHERHFCGECGSHLWAFHPAWPELIHPVASAVDSPLPGATQSVHMMLDFKADWVPIQAQRGDAQFEGYPSDSIADYHEARDWTVD